MTPAATRALAFARDQFRRVRDAARRHPYRAALLLPALVLLYVLVLIPFTPSIGDLRKAKSEVPSVVLSSDGVVLAEYKRINRAVGAAREDLAARGGRADRHRGPPLLRAPRHRLPAHRRRPCCSTLSGDRQGGSTITQQLARNLYPEEIGRALTLTRKIKEAITALKIEAVYTKDEILETYLNTVPFLYNAFGIEMAARTYFDKSADKLDVLESATLVGMLKGTSYYNPVLNPERALRAPQPGAGADGQARQAGRRRRSQALAKRPLRLDFERQVEPLGPAPHVAQHLRKWLIEWADRSGYDIYADGLVVRTTHRLQAAEGRQPGGGAPAGAAADAGRRAGARRARSAPLLQAGFLALDPRNGYVRAWVGSRDFAQEQFDHVSQARRQPGSTFKPFVYGAAFDAGHAARRRR